MRRTKSSIRKTGLNIKSEEKAEGKKGLTGHIAARKPLLWIANTLKRLADKYQKWTIGQWKHVLWTDELKFEIFGSKRRVFVRKK